MTVSCQVLRFYVNVPRVVRIWESFFYSQALFTFPTFATVPRLLRMWERFFTLREFFLSYTHFPTFGTTCNYQGFPGSRQFFLAWRLQVLPLRFETQIRPIFLFESHSVQQKVLVGRFYLCVKALRNTISTSSRFWTHSLIAIWIVRGMLYPLDHRSSKCTRVYKLICRLFANKLKNNPLKAAVHESFIEFYE